MVTNDYASEHEYLTTASAPFEHLLPPNTPSTLHTCSHNPLLPGIMVRYSTDLKMAAVRLRHRGRDSVKEISRITNMSRPTLFRTWRKHRLTGTVANKQPIGQGHPRSVLFRDAEYLVRLAHHNPGAFLDEYCKRLEDDRYLSIHVTTIHRFFTRAGLSVKRVQKLARERDPMKRADYIRRIGKHSPACLVFLDEVSKNDRIYARLWGRAPAGERVECYAPFVRGRRLSMLAGMALDEGITAAKVVEGSFTKASFLSFLRHDLVRSRSLISCSFLMLFLLATNYNMLSWTP